jgi:hypothetical protein
MDNDKIREKAIKYVDEHSDIKGMGLYDIMTGFALDFALSLQEPEVKPFPQEGEIVFIRVADGVVRTDYSGGFHSGELRQGRVHRTEAEAIRAHEIEAATAEIRRWRDENCPFTPDWGNKDQKKWYSVYGHSESKWYRSYTAKIEIPNTIYFASPDDLTRCQSELPDAWAALVGVK